MYAPTRLGQAGRELLGQTTGHGSQELDGAQLGAPPKGNKRPLESSGDGGNSQHIPALSG